MKSLKCDMTKDCTAVVTHIDANGFIYCAKHGALRQQYQKCRKLRPQELKQLAIGTLSKY